MVTYSPGQAARHSGFSLETLRYYERIGLLNDVARASGGHRIFSDDDIAWLTILRCLRDTGMPIATMQRYAELARSGEATYAERVTVLEEHDRAIEASIAVLREQQERIREKITWYSGAQGAAT